MTFLEEVKSLLSQAQRKPVAIPKEVLKEFLKDCKQAVEKQFTQERESEFRIRMSSIGKPLCQLQMEKKYSGGNAIVSYENYNNKLKFLFGDILEAIVVMLLRTTKANIQGVQKNVKYKTKWFDMKGTYDIIIDDKVYDIKSNIAYIRTNAGCFNFQLDKNKPIQKGNKINYIISADLMNFSSVKPKKSNIINCRLISEEYVGSIVTLFLESTDGTEFKIQITERELSKFNIQNGNKYWLSWSEKNVHVLIEE